MAILSLVLVLLYLIKKRAMSLCCANEYEFMSLWVILSWIFVDKFSANWVEVIDEFTCVSQKNVTMSVLGMQLWVHEWVLKKSFMSILKWKKRFCPFKYPREKSQTLSKHMTWVNSFILLPNWLFGHSRLPNNLLDTWDRELTFSGVYVPKGLVHVVARLDSTLFWSYVCLGRRKLGEVCVFGVSC